MNQMHHERKISDDAADVVDYAFGQWSNWFKWSMNNNRIDSIDPFAINEQIFRWSNCSTNYERNDSNNCWMMNEFIQVTQMLHERTDSNDRSMYNERTDSIKPNVPWVLNELIQIFHDTNAKFFVH